MTAAQYKGGHPPGNDLGLHYTALPPIVASYPYSDQLLVTRKFWSPGANRPSQASDVVANTAPPWSPCAALSSTALVSSSTNSGTPSVRWTISATISAASPA